MAVLVQFVRIGQRHLRWLRKSAAKALEMAKKISGTKEWAKSSLNIAKGCEHGCRYCYARQRALRFHRIQSAEEWLTPALSQKEVDRKRNKRQGVIMYPTTHDISPALLQPSIAVLLKLCDAENTVLVVSKPHLSCVEAMCAALAQHNTLGTNRIFFRFTIGSLDNKILEYWEPHAPPAYERVQSLAHAYHAGFRTSVSIEPMLDSLDGTMALVGCVRPYVTDSVWIGKMNKVDKRVKIETPEDQLRVATIQLQQTDELIHQLYGVLKDDPLIRWKESIKSVVGLPLAEEAGLDI